MFSSYNGLGFRKSHHEDENSSGAADGSDPTHQLIYDERWRLIATYRDDDDNPKEAFVYHQAGLDGTGSSSYIDSVILRQRDDNSGWTSAADGTLEQRRYYCQNWRADVSAIVTSAGVMVGCDKYTAKANVDRSTGATNSPPFGSESWVKRTAAALGLEHAFRPRGRPRKAATA